MNEFLHTLSGVTYLTKPQFDRMKDSYNNKELFPYNNEKWVFCKYAKRGFRAEIIYTPYIERWKAKRYEEHKMTWFVTPAKLMFPGQPMAKLYTPEEYTQACDLLAEIWNEIKADSGADFLHKAKLYRVDLTKDITTPSEEYTHEVIRLAKIALNKYGYHLWKPDDIEERKEEWRDENAAFFHNDNQEVQSKIYDKVSDLRIQGYDTTGLSGLLRFELALKRQFMKDNGYIQEKYITPDTLADKLHCILAQASDLMQKHIADPLWSGTMVSKDQQKKAIRRYCGFKTDSAKYKKMIAYRKACNRAKSMENVKKNSAAEGYFREMGVSPLYCSEVVGRIPSFSELLAEKGMIM